MGISRLVRVRTELSLLTRTGPLASCPDERISVALRAQGRCAGHELRRQHRPQPAQPPEILRLGQANGCLDRLLPDGALGLADGGQRRIQEATERQILEVVNSSDAAQTPTITLNGYSPTTSTAQVSELGGARTDQNDASDVNQVTPEESSASIALADGAFSATFAANSFTVLRLE
ncbi:MAG TPA: hypothetical protein VM686_27995 [Polyangiaceae bacterium]|nr:hypothetical protein [Polyangiaceae bacterium]